MRQAQDTQDTQDTQGLLEEVQQGEVQQAKRRRVRQACNPCRQRKIKCDGRFPCAYCIKAHKQCTPPFNPALPARPRAIRPEPAPEHGPQLLPFNQQQPQPQPQPQQMVVPRPQYGQLQPLQFQSQHDDSDEQQLSEEWIETIPPQLHSVLHVFGNRELKFVDIYFKFCHNYIPVVTKQQLKEALRRNAMPAHQIVPSDMGRTAAFLANAWAAAAIGASFYDPDSAMQCLNLAVQHIRSCFDNPTPETIHAYLAVCEAYYRLDVKDVQTWAKYVGFANVLEAEMSDRLPPQVKALFDYYRTILRNNTTLETERLEYPTRLNFVETRSDVPFTLREFDLNTLCVQHCSNLVRGRHLDQAELRRQTALFIPPLMEAHQRLVATGATRGPEVIKFFVVCLFLIHFNIKLGRLSTAIQYLRDQTPLHEVIPVYRWPRNRRMPFLTICVLEALHCEDLAQVIRNVVNAAGVQWDGRVEQHKVDEMMWVDMYNDVLYYQALEEEQRLQHQQRQHAEQLLFQQLIPEQLTHHSPPPQVSILQQTVQHVSPEPHAPPIPQLAFDTRREKIWHPARVQELQRQQAPFQQQDHHQFQSPPQGSFVEIKEEPLPLLPADELLESQIFELPFEELLAPTQQASTPGLSHDTDESSSRDITYELLQPNIFEDLSAFFAETDL